MTTIHRMLWATLIGTCTALPLSMSLGAEKHEPKGLVSQERVASIERVLPAERTDQQRLALAQAYFQQGRLDAAFQQADEILKNRPDDADAWVIQGDIWRERKQWQRALTAFDRAAKIRPGRAEIELRRGGALMALGKTREADLAFGRYRALSQVQSVGTNSK